MRIFVPDVSMHPFQGVFVLRVPSEELVPFESSETVHLLYKRVTPGALR